MFDKGLLTAADAEPSTSYLYMPTKRSDASRRPALRTKASTRGSIVNDAASQEIVVESQLERRLGMILLAQRDVVSIEDQPKAVEYVDENGEVRLHTLDFRAGYISRKRIAFAVKAAGQVKTSGICDVLSRVRKRSLQGFADEIVLLTENQITIGRAWNAQRVIRALKGKNDHHCEELRVFAAQFRGAVSVSDLISGFDIPAHGFNAMFCLIHEGFLTLINKHEKIEDTSLLAVHRNS